MKITNRVSLLVTLTISMLIFTFAIGAFAQDATPVPAPAEWGYEGEEGPANW